MPPKPFSWDRDAARAGRYDGKFLVGVLSTGIYCLPSCRARQPKPQNVRVLASEAEARAAGLRACKRCRPDAFYRGEDADIALFDGLAARVRAAPEAFGDAAALARACGVSRSKLGDLIRTHAHLTPVAWLRRERARAACRALLESGARVVDIGQEVGFDSESAFHRQFLLSTRMTPGAYRALAGASVFMLHLPARYRAAETLAYHGRDPGGPCERVEGNRIFKALATPDGAAVLEISIEAAAAWCRVHADARLGPEALRGVHAAALRMLGLATDVAAFETRVRRDARMAVIVARRRGLRLPLTATGFEALCWAIIGQQINIRFASALRRTLLDLTGEPSGDMRAHPPPERVAALEPAVLARRRYSRAKAEYLIGAARAIAAGELHPERLADGSAVAAEQSLTRLRGIGPWTARYTLMRGAGFADCAPIGDVALAAALKQLHAADGRPAPARVEELMRAYAPHRSLATFHLWSSLRDPA